MYEKEIEVKIRELPEYLKKEVLDYVEFLLNKLYAKSDKSDRLRYTWEGGLSELKEKYTSVELQHKALDWR